MANKHNNETHKEIVHAPHDKRSEENGRELSAMGDAKIIRQRMLVRQRMLDWKATSYKIEVADEASVVPPDFIPVQEGPSPDVIADFVRLAGSFTIEDGTSYIVAHDATHPLNSTVRNALVLAQGMANAPRWAADYVCKLLKKGAIRTAKITEKTHGALEGDTLEQLLVGPAKDVNHNLETIISMQLRGAFFRISELTTMRKDQVIADEVIPVDQKQDTIRRKHIYQHPEGIQAPTKWGCRRLWRSSFSAVGHWATRTLCPTLNPERTTVTASLEGSGLGEVSPTHPVYAPKWVNPRLIHCFPFSHPIQTTPGGVSRTSRPRDNTICTKTRSTVMIPPRQADGSDGIPTDEMTENKYAHDENHTRLHWGQENERRNAPGARAPTTIEDSADNRPDRSRHRE